MMEAPLSDKKSIYLKKTQRENVFGCLTFIDIYQSHDYVAQMSRITKTQ